MVLFSSCFCGCGDCCCCSFDDCCRDVWWVGSISDMVRERRPRVPPSCDPIPEITGDDCLLRPFPALRSPLVAGAVGDVVGENGPSLQSPRSTLFFAILVEVLRGSLDARISTADGSPGLEVMFSLQARGGSKCNAVVWVDVEGRVAAGSRKRRRSRWEVLAWQALANPVLSGSVL